MRITDLESIISDIVYKEWQFTINQRGGGELFLQAIFMDDYMEQKTREWYIDRRATKSQVVQTAMALVLLAEEHEAREWFRYKGAKVFGPHLDVDFLVENVKQKVHLDVK